MSNPLDDETALFNVLINPEGQYSLWPVFAAIPAGWDAVLKGVERSACLAYIDANWTDMRPRSLRETMSQESES